VIRASRAAYLVCGVLTAPALAGWGVRAAGTPHSNTASSTTVPLDAPTAQAAGAGANADNEQANDANNALSQDQAAAAPATQTDVTTKLIAKKVPKMGDVVTDDQGFVLYRFDKDTAKPPVSNCDAKCSKTWPVLTTKDGNAPQLEGVDSNLVTMTKRADGIMQVTLNGWSLYHYIGDQKAGKWTGQGVGGIWWVSDHVGRKNLTCVPTSTPTAVTPPDDNNKGASNTGTSNNSGGGDTAAGSGSSGY
jgi:predicted lipoprotein with Yx(FWY)xxD motif